MPYSWTPPEQFIEHKGVCIFHTYKDDMAENSKREFWYTVSATGGDGTEFEFDVRNLPGLAEAGHAQTIMAAIDAGLLRQDEPPPAWTRI